MKDASGFRLVLVTVPSEEEGGRIARVLVGEGLAACVNIVPRVRSVYRWKGKIQEDAESLLIIKTLDAMLQDLERRVVGLHSYDVPEVIALPIDRGREDYLDWLEGCCKGSSG